MSQLSLLCLFCAATLPLAAQHQPYRISGPYTHENLSIFLIHGASQSKARKYLTLQEALAQRKVVVHETGQVRELAVENVSSEDIYIQSGDIVKGGQQDRVISNDFVLPSKSGKVPVASFCVEQGRWSQRGSEPVHAFMSAEGALPTKQLKTAVKSKKDQAEVWARVREAQVELAASIGGASMDRAGGGPLMPATASLPLTLENKRLGEHVDSYLRKLSGITAAHKDVIGYAFAINGELNSADVYSSPSLFASLWTKLLKASATEAVSKSSRNKRSLAPGAAAVSAMLADAETGKASTTHIGGRVELIEKETARNLYFESRDGEGWVHRNYIVK